MDFYSFETKHALKYGINEAIFINLLKYWIQHNRANKKNFFDGRTWSYNTNEAWAESIPLFSPTQIKRILKSLEDQSVIKIGCFNENPFDRTRWYAFVDESEFLPPLKEPIEPKTNPSKNQNRIINNTKHKSDGDIKNTASLSNIQNRLMQSPKSSIVHETNSSDVVYSQYNTNKDTIQNNSMPPAKKSSSELVETNDLQLQSLVNEWGRFAHEIMPHLAIDEKTWLRELHRIKDHLKCDSDLLMNIFKFISNDEFWSRNAVSPIGLMRKSTNNLRKVDNIYAKMTGSKSFKLQVMQENFKQVSDDITW